MITREQFDTITAGLAAQGWVQSLDPVLDICTYRGPNGTKCAIGQLIPDDKYRKEMDTDSWGLNALKDSGLLGNLTDSEFHQLRDAHDDNDQPEHMRHSFDRLRTQWFPSP